jgi:tRNA(adenine34) deaminase
MQRAMELAERARMAGNVPVGAVLVMNDEAIGQAAEQVPNGPRAFAHAELLAVEAALAAGPRELRAATLYSTAEPCILCGFAIREAKIGRVVMGRAAGAIGSVRSRFPVLSANDVERWGAPPVVVWWNEGREGQPVVDGGDLGDIAQAMRDACVEAALQAYDDAGIRGLCAEGRWEVALAAIQMVDLSSIARRAR